MEIITLTTAEQAELANIRQNQPVFPGDTLSHATVKRLSGTGLIHRDQSGNWVSTDVSLT